MNELKEELCERYAEGLKRYGEGRAQEALSIAYDVGYALMIDGAALSTVAALHHRTLAKIVDDGRSSGATLIAGQELLAELLAPYESTHRRNSASNTALRRLTEALDLQAKRIAHALHDEAGQLLATAHMAIADLARELPAGSQERINDVKGLLDRIEEEIRQVSHELRPTILDDLGLVPALEFLGQAAERRTGVKVQVEGSTAERLPPNVEMAVYRIVQEGLTNVCRHAGARRASVQFRREGQLVHCSLVDDGRGFNSAELADGRVTRGLGLIGIRERLDALGGTLVFNSVPGGGTSMFVTIPLNSR